MREIEERNRAAERLSESEERYRALYEASADGIFLLDHSGTILDANEASLRMYGYPLEELKGTKVIELIHPDDLKLKPFRFKEMLRGETIRIERRMRRKDGTHLHVEVTGRCVGENLVQGLYRDITERKLAEEARKQALESANILEKIFATTHSCIVFLDKTFNFIRVNQAYADTCGYPPEFFPGKNHFDLFPHAENEAIFRQVLETGQPFTAYARPFEFPGHPDRGTTYWDWTVHQVTGSQGQVDGVIIVLVEVTQRELATQKLRESENTLSTVLRATPTGIGLAVNGTFKWTNEAMSLITGYSENELSALDPSMLYPSYDEYETARTHLSAQMQAHITATVETQWRHKSGSAMHIILSSAAVDQANPLAGAVFTAVDITARRHADEERLAALKEIEDLYHHAPCGYHSLDDQGMYVRINDTELSWLGYTNEEIIGKKSFQDLITSESLTIFEENFPVLLQSGGIRDLEFDMICKDGSTFPVLLSATAIRDASGNFVRSRSTMFDITERRQAQERLRESEERYRQMFQNNRAVKLLIDPESSAILDANQAAAEFYGYELARLKQMKIVDINMLSPDEIYQEMSRAYAEEKDYFEFRHRLATGETRHVEVYSSPISLHGKTLLYSIVHDITERHRVQEELMRSNRELQQFAYVASHDLQEPLRNVANCMHMLEKAHKGRFGPEAEQLMNYAVESVKRMKTLIQDLLTYSRVATKEETHSLIDCEDVLKLTLLNLSTSIKEHGAVITHDPLPTVKADAAQLAQVFQNLIGNALKFHGTALPRIHVSAARNGREWVFAVKDNGIGIEPRHFERIFVIFQRLHKRTEYDGTGIGLAIVKRIVERHSGQIWVNSEPGKGTIFFFTLPIQEDVTQC